jgi:lambda family phage portal protein
MSKQPQGTWLDRAVLWLSPERGLRRMAARDAALSLYRGARSDRPRKDWLTLGGSPDEDTLEDLPTLRARSRDLVANNSMARAIIHGINRAVVGHGLTPQPAMDNQPLGIADAKAEELQEIAEQLWDEWAPAADLEQMASIYELQALADWSEDESGDVLMLRHIRPGVATRVKTRWQCIEGDRLATPSGTQETAALRGGIRVDADGVPVAYFVKRTHPGDIKFGATNPKDFVEVPARDESGRLNVIHLFSRRTRPGQRRGLPLLSHCMQDLKDLGEYIEAELVGARVQACQALIVKGKGRAARIKGATSERDSSTGSRIETIEPGHIHYMGNDDDLVPFTPNRPSGNITPFVEMLLKRIGASIGIPYEVMVLDFWRRSWSSARAALLASRMGCYLPRRAWLVKNFCQVAWEAMLEEAFLAGDWPVPLGKTSDFYRFKSAICRATWVGPAFGWVDPEKELKAVELGMKLGLDTWQMAAAEQGYHYLDLAAQVKIETRLRKAVGLPQPGVQPGMPEAKDAKDDKKPHPTADKPDKGDTEADPNADEE